MMGRQKVDQSQPFYLFKLEGRIPGHYLLRRINPTVTRLRGLAGALRRSPLRVRPLRFRWLANLAGP
jgi:hypothetical protein